MAVYARAASALSLCLAAAVAVRAGDMCPAPPKHSSPLADPFIIDDHLIHFDADDFRLDSNGHAALKGHVKVHQDARTMSADSMNYDYGTGKLTVAGSVDFEDPKLRIKSDTGRYDSVGGADFDEANFQILDRNGRGFARTLAVDPDGNVQLDQVRYTTCPVGNQDWMLQASSITLDTTDQEGSARHVLMRFKGVPIFYTPALSFPLGDERKSGVLFPNFGHSGTNGYQLQVPYYFNLAPNYDLTLTPGILSTRGVQLGGEFRYLTAASHGQIEATFLPDDKITHSDRSYFHATDVTDLREGLRFDADLAAVSDTNYFSDFAVGSEQTSVTYLQRRAEVQYYDDSWRIRAELQNFQTIDTLVTGGFRPYSRLPRVQADGLFPLPGSPLEFALEGEATDFVREAGPNGVRLDLSPELRWSSRGPGWFFEPALGYRFTQYDLENATPGDPSTPTRALPYGRLDTGLVFERDAGSANQRTQTLEPRMMYSYVPYRNQNLLPIFDTALPDLNLTELFRTNRFVGDDRIGDANQLAVGLTTRLFDHVSGTQYLSATIGQIRYFSTPRVLFPNAFYADSGEPSANSPIVNPLQLPQPLLTACPFQTGPKSPAQYFINAQGQCEALVTGTATGQNAGINPASDLVSEVDLTGYKHLSVDIKYLYNPYQSQIDKLELGVQYHPEPAKVVNLGYRFQEGILKQYDGSFAWPIAGHWNTVGRWVYSVADHQTIEQVAGFEYKSCCWRVQLVQRRYLRRPDPSGSSPTDLLHGTLDTSIALQLELTGLSSVGKPADSYLEHEIRGYTAHETAVP
jgi:LPS-assembly protein